MGGHVRGGIGVTIDTWWMATGGGGVSIKGSFQASAGGERAGGLSPAGWWKDGRYTAAAAVDDAEYQERDLFRRPQEGGVGKLNVSRWKGTDGEMGMKASTRINVGWAYAAVEAGRTSPQKIPSRFNKVGGDGDGMAVGDTTSTSMSILDGGGAETPAHLRPST